MPTIDDILLNINNVTFKSMICQSAIQTAEDKEQYRAKGYDIELTEQEFKEHFHVDPSCVWYTPSISSPSLYFNPETLAAAPFHVNLILGGQCPITGSLYQFLDEIETEVANNDFSGSIGTLPDAMRIEYFKLLIDKKGSDIPDLYHLFFSTYCRSDYGFNNIDPQTFKTILNSKTIEEKAKTEAKLRDLPDTLTIYRGGNTASTPFEKAYSWTLDINVANFFACRRGFGEGYIVEAEVDKKDVIESFLDEMSESEVVVDPQNIRILSKIPVRGVDFIAPILPEISPMYLKYKEQMKDLEFAQDSLVHGPEHQARVLLLSLTIAHLMDLPQSDRKLLATAAVFHDTQRTNDDEDPTHGEASKDYYHATVKNPEPLVEFLCKYHCLPDDLGYKEIMNNRQLSKNRSRAKLLYDIFKDADALERVRFGLRALDLNQLRLPVSKELSLTARLYQEQVKVEMKPKLKKASLSSKIQTAKSKAASSSVSTHKNIKQNSHEYR